jgi:hypothetical protein
MPSVLVVDDSRDPLALGEEELEGVEHLVLVSWSAPGTRSELERRHGLRCHGLEAAAGEPTEWEAAALELSRRVVAAGENVHGMPWRGVIEEALYREAVDFETLRRSVDHARRLAGGEEPRFCLAPTRAAWLGLGGPPERPSLPRRLLRRLRGARLTGDLWRQPALLLAQLDARLRLRLAWGRRLPGPRVSPGPVTLFSTYANNTRLLAAFADRLPAPVHWLVTHPRGGTAAAAGHPLWRFAPPGAVTSHDHQGPPELSGRAARWLEHSSTWQRYWRRHGPVAVARLVACWEHYLDTVRPRLVVVANQHSLEGLFLALARRRGIPVLQLLHGVVGGELYTGAVHSDLLLVWGEFWRRLWPEAQRDRVRVVPPPPGVVVRRQRRAPAHRVRITLFSWPFTEQALYPAAELWRILVDVLDGALARGNCEVLVRAHPVENLDDLTTFWRRRRGALPSGLELDRGSTLEAVLERTDIALMFRSTVMLDCLASGIPVLIPGWIDFHWRRQLEGVEGLCLAADEATLESTLKAWIDSPPRPSESAVEPFVCSGEGAVFEKEVEALLRRGGGEVAT